MWLFRMQRTAAAVASRAGYFPEFPSESGTQMNLRSDIVAPSAGRKKASSILQHTIIRIPTTRQCVQSVLIRRNCAAIIIACRGN